MTTFSPRSIVSALVAFGLLGGSAAVAQDYPTQDVRFICAFPAGSGADVIVRFFSDKMRPIIGRTIIVENKPGASGNIATEFVARSKPDGHTIYLHTGSSTAANMHIFKKPPVDAAKALQVAATINRQGFMVVVDPKSPFKTLPELTAFIKQKGEKASYATSNASGKVIGELYKSIAGLKAVEVNYRTANDSLNDFASGAVDYGVQDPIFALAQVRQNRLRVLAVATATRLASEPGIPTFAEQGVPGIDVTGWFAAFVPAATPRPIVDKLNGWFNALLATDEAKVFLNQYGGDPWISTPDQGQAKLLDDIKAWGEYVKIAKIEPQG